MDDFDDIPNMDNNHRELMEWLTDNPEMRKAAQNSLKQGALAGGAAVAGGLIAGPPGGLIGGILGSIAGFFVADEYDGVVQQMLNMNDTDKKKRLMGQVQRVLLSAGATAKQLESTDAFRNALVEFAGQRNVRDQVWRACMDTLKD